ncbi:MAG: hypothetical protein COS95_00020 [Ignavibacteriales bacterium CG07_land_8_20_14_0_80_59_12]|nr:MAG: hypothetical protein COS95_00020 [Ignavibacteriales bacterium CG07_land_8_20_14_0_80_59_12]
MPYVIRNSIVLGSMLLLVVLLGGYYRWIHQAGKERAIARETQAVEAELQRTALLVDELNSTTKEVSGIVDRWSRRSKDIPEADYSSGTYAYLNQLIDWSGFVKLDMVYIGATKMQNHGYNTYGLRGEALFQNLYRFLWYIENGRRLYKVNSIALRGIEVREKEDIEPQYLVAFDMEIRAYHTSLKGLASAENAPAVIPAFLSFSPFMPLILSDVPPNINDLVEVERSQLRAVIPGKAFVADQKNRVVTLEEGDEVYLGYVTKIVPEEGRVEFTLNKGGIVERFELRTTSRTTNK